MSACRDEERVHPARPDPDELGGILKAATTSIVGFTGRRRSGKDTAARELMDCGYMQASFAGPLKAMLRSLLIAQGLTRTEVVTLIDGDAKELPTPYLAGRSPRYAMQTLGTEWGRDLIASDLWVGAAMRRASQNERTVFTDVRFPNEVSAIHAAGGVVIRIVRPSLANDDTHESEALTDSLTANATVLNIGSVEDLNRRVGQALKELRR